MPEKNKVNGLMLKKTTLRILNEQELHWVAGGEGVPVDPIDLPISWAYTTNQTTTNNTGTRPAVNTDTVQPSDTLADRQGNEEFLNVFP